MRLLVSKTSLVRKNVEISTKDVGAREKRLNWEKKMLLFSSLGIVIMQIGRPQRHNRRLATHFEYSSGNSVWAFLFHVFMARCNANYRNLFIKSSGNSRNPSLLKPRHRTYTYCSWRKKHSWQSCLWPSVERALACLTAERATLASRMFVSGLERFEKRSFHFA